MIIRKAKKEDSDAILRILKELDLYHPARIPEDFWVAKDKERIVGVSCLADHGEFLFLSSVGVKEESRGKGVAKKMIQEILKDTEKDICLYTIIPDFFKKIGFKTMEDQHTLPSRDDLKCEDCDISSCVPMIKNKTL